MARPAGIREWRERVANAYEYTVEVRGAAARGQVDGVERHDVYTHLEGNFPGGTVDLTNRFGLRDGRIARLEIVPDRRRPSRDHPEHRATTGPIRGLVQPAYNDDERTEFVVQAESLGYPTAGSGSAGRRSAISPSSSASSTQRPPSSSPPRSSTCGPTTRRHRRVVPADRCPPPDRFLLGFGIGHPESITTYRQPYATIVDYLDQLDAGGVPTDRRILAALGPGHSSSPPTAHWAPTRISSFPDHTRDARQLLGPDVVIAPEHKVVLETDPDVARSIGRPFVAEPLPQTPQLHQQPAPLRLHRRRHQCGRKRPTDRRPRAAWLHRQDRRPGSEHTSMPAPNHVAIQVLTADGHNPMAAYQQLAHTLL